MSALFTSPKSVRQLSCAVCGAYCRGRQWHNRDDGYGLCGSCPGWLSGRGVDAAEMEHLYGVPGVHYFVEEAS